jgi:hypothetical protein
MPYSGLATAALLLLLLIVATSAMACVEQEKSSLLQFLAELSHDGGIAMSWQNGTNCCVWEGITSLSRLNLSYNSLSGGLPAELMSSGSIVVLDVSFNRLNGDLPPSAAIRHLLLFLILGTTSSVATSPLE